MTENLLVQMAQKARQNSALFAPLIADFGEKEEMEWHEIAAYLGIDELSLARLALCRRPRETNLIEDLTQIGNYVNIDRQLLLRFFRRAESLEAFSKNSEANSQWLIAARDEDSSADDDQSE